MTYPVTETCTFTIESILQISVTSCKIDIWYKEGIQFPNISNNFQLTENDVNVTSHQMKKSFY